MNGPIFISGLAAVFCTLGHFTAGSKHYLKPMLAASFDDVAKVDDFRIYRDFCVAGCGLKGHGGKVF